MKRYIIQYTEPHYGGERKDSFYVGTSKQLGRIQKGKFLHEDVLHKIFLKAANNAYKNQQFRVMNMHLLANGISCTVRNVVEMIGISFTLMPTVELDYYII